jgi:hypothetical protein
MPRKYKGNARGQNTSPNHLSQGQSPFSATASNPDSPQVASSSDLGLSQSPSQMSSTQSSPALSPVLHLRDDPLSNFALSQDDENVSVHSDGQPKSMPVILEQDDDRTSPKSPVNLEQEVTNKLLQVIKDAPGFAQSFSPLSGGTRSPVLDPGILDEQTTNEPTKNITCLAHTQSSKTQDSQKNSQNKVLIDKLIEITKTYQSHLQTQQTITTHDEEGKLADKVRIINEILAQLNQVTDSDKLKIFRQSLEKNKDILSKHRTGQGERYLQLASIICFSAIAIAVPAITISLEIGLVMLAATLALIAAVSIYHRVETNSWNFFAPRGQLYCEEAERHLLTCS